MGYDALASLKMERKEYSNWRKLLLSMIPKKVEEEIYPGCRDRRDVSGGEVIDNLATFYVLRDLGPSYCFLPKSKKKERLELFCQNHGNKFYQSNGKIFREIVESHDPKSVESLPSKLHEAYVDCGKEEWVGETTYGNRDYSRAYAVLNSARDRISHERQGKDNEYLNRINEELEPVIPEQMPLPLKTV